MTTSDVPDAALAGALAAAATGHRPAAVRRFTTGSQHYVFEVELEGRAPVVVRASLSRGRALAAGSVKFSRLLRPLDVPLPAIIAEDLDAAFPYVVFERLPGTDLGHVIGTLAEAQLGAIAAKVARLQRIVAMLPTAGRYGYAADPAEAPRRHWSDILDDSIARSRGRIAARGYYDLGPVAAAEAVLARLRREADEQRATPYLHDTTTKNVIIAPDGTLSGIVDVDDLCYGDPRSPVALTMAATLAFTGGSGYADFWMKHAGHRDDRLFRLYVALCLLDFMSEQGQVFNGNESPPSPEARRHLQELFETQLRLAGG
ncbi:MAG: aminoglycoside phosphotransferase family protein [Devosia sp.]